MLSSRKYGTLSLQLFKAEFLGYLTLKNLQIEFEYFSLNFDTNAHPHVRKYIPQQDTFIEKTTIRVVLQQYQQKGKNKKRVHIYVLPESNYCLMGLCGSL